MDIDISRDISSYFWVGHTKFLARKMKRGSKIEIPPNLYTRFSNRERMYSKCEREMRCDVIPALLPS